jgi:hypothetical protein
MTIYIIDGDDLSRLLGSIQEHGANRTDWDRRITALRLEPRRDGIAVKINRGEWSPVIGRVENADAPTAEEWEERNNASLRAIVAAQSATSEAASPVQTLTRTTYTVVV